MLASGLRSSNPAVMESALLAARESESDLNNAVNRANVARRQIRWTINRRQDALWAEIANRDAMLERAMRSLRVLARRLRFDAAEAEAVERAWLANILTRYSSACIAYAEAIRNTSGSSYHTLTGTAAEAQAQAELYAIAHDLTHHHTNDQAISTGAAVFRAVIADTLQAAGASLQQANAALLTNA
jgi:hypothetical protein